MKRITAQNGTFLMDVIKSQSRCWRHLAWHLKYESPEGLSTRIMASKRNRISIPKEDRIWDLRCQGYDYDSIARIANIPLGSTCRVIQRVRQRPPLSKDPIKRGRKSGFLSDRQVHEIRLRWRCGETQLSIAKEFGLHESSINKICSQKTYCEPCNDDTCDGYPFTFTNRLVAS